MSGWPDEESNSCQHCKWETRLKLKTGLAAIEIEIEKRQATYQIARAALVAAKAQRALLLTDLAYALGKEGLALEDEADWFRGEAFEIADSGLVDGIKKPT